MRKLAPLLFGIALLSPVGLAGQGVDTASTVRASGSATVSVRPTLATITFTMSATDASASRAGAKVAAVADSLRTAIAALGVPRDSLVSGSRWRWWQGRLTTQVSRPYCEDPNRPLNRCTQRQDTTYTVQDRVEARISDFDVLGAVVDAALELGITEMTDFRFSAPDRIEAEDRALAEATSRARRRAQIMAEALGARLGRLRLISTEAAASRSYGFGPDVMLSSTGAQVVVPDLNVGVTVYGTWDIEKPDTARRTPPAVR